MQQGASLEWEESSRNFVEELLFEVDVNVNVLFRMVRARKGFRPENVFPAAPIVDFARFSRCTRRNFVD